MATPKKKTTARPSYRLPRPAHTRAATLTAKGKKAQQTYKRRQVRQSIEKLHNLFGTYRKKTTAKPTHTRAGALTTKGKKATAATNLKKRGVIWQVRRTKHAMSKPIFRRK